MNVQERAIQSEQIARASIGRLGNERLTETWMLTNGQPAERKFQIGPREVLLHEESHLMWDRHLGNVVYRFVLGWGGEEAPYLAVVRIDRAQDLWENAHRLRSRIDSKGVQTWQ